VSASTPGFRLTARHCVLGLGLLVGGLALPLIAAPQIGMPLVAFALLIGVVIVFALASTELERDVIHMALAGAIFGLLVEYFLGGRAGVVHGTIFGLVIGALIGDEVQLSRKWIKLTRQTREESRWWQKLPLESRWLPRVVCGLCGFSILGGLTLVVLCDRGLLPRGEESQLVDELFRLFRARRIETNPWSTLGNAWFAIIPLCMSIALSRFAAQVPNRTLLIDGLLRRIGVLQCVALLLLAYLAAVSILREVSVVSHGNVFSLSLEVFVDSLRITLAPLLLLMVAQVFLGKRMLRYWQRSGWLVALGLLGLTSVFTLGLLLAYLLQF
jgi:hypothetical protein